MLCINFVNQLLMELYLLLKFSAEIRLEEVVKEIFWPKDWTEACNKPLLTRLQRL